MNCDITLYVLWDFKLVYVWNSFVQEHLCVCPICVASALKLSTPPLSCLYVLALCCAYSASLLPLYFSSDIFGYKLIFSYL